MMLKNHVCLTIVFLEVDILTGRWQDRSKPNRMLHLITILVLLFHSHLIYNLHTYISFVQSRTTTSYLIISYFQLMGS